MTTNTAEVQMKPVSELIASMKAAAEKATPLQLDTAQLERGNDGYFECPCCEGAGEVEAENDFCNIDGAALGVQFYGIGEHHGLAERYFRQVTPVNVLALIAALEAANELNKHLDLAIRKAEGCSEKLRAGVEAAERRVAELEASKLSVKLPAACADDEYFIDGVFQPMRYERDVERAIRAAGGTVEGSD